MINWGDFELFFSTGLPSEVLYSSLIIMALVIVIGVCSKRVANKKRYVLWSLLTEYIFIVVCSTIICRGPQSFKYARLELTPFWTYEAVWNQVPGVSVWDIVLNVVLFIPLGFLVKLLFTKLKLWRMALIALLCSVFIETNQYIFEKGIAQFDDVFHNTIGAMVGWSVAWLCLRLTCGSKY